MICITYIKYKLYNWLNDLFFKSQIQLANHLILRCSRALIYEQMIDFNLMLNAWRIRRTIYSNKYSNNYYHSMHTNQWYHWLLTLVTGIRYILIFYIFYIFYNLYSTSVEFFIKIFQIREEKSDSKRWFMWNPQI